jgi:hypothetical protein
MRTEAHNRDRHFARKNGEESDQVSLNFTRAFKMTDASAYGLRSDLVLKGRPH